MKDDLSCGGAHKSGKTPVERKWDLYLNVTIKYCRTIPSVFRLGLREKTILKPEALFPRKCTRRRKKLENRLKKSNRTYVLSAWNIRPEDFFVFFFVFAGIGSRKPPDIILNRHKFWKVMNRVANSDTYVRKLFSNLFFITQIKCNGKISCSSHAFHYRIHYIVIKVKALRSNLWELLTFENLLRFTHFAHTYFSKVTLLIFIKNHKCTWSPSANRLIIKIILLEPNNNYFLADFFIAKKKTKIKKKERKLLQLA